MADKHYQNEIGTAIILQTGVDISTATVHKIFLKKPDGTSEEKTATIENTTDLQYITITGDLAECGEYMAQGYVELPSGWKGYTETAEFTILSPFE